MILSVSRRTDIPAFFSEWFMKRIREGFYYVRNPMNANQVSEVKCSADVVDCIVFWTKYPRPLMKYLPELDERGYKYYFTYSLTGYGKDLEPNMVAEGERIRAFQELSQRLGVQRVIWRYDPILLTEQYDLAYHLQKFGSLLEQLGPYTEKCVFSFVDLYRKIQQNMRDIKVLPMDDGFKNALAEGFAKMVKEQNTKQPHVLQLATCAEGINLDKYGIIHNSCIDPVLIENIIGCKLNSTMGSDRPGTVCGCAKCHEMGTFDTCLFGCKYCYANNGDLPQRNRQYCHADSPYLLDDSGKFPMARVKIRTGIKSDKIVGKRTVNKQDANFEEQGSLWN